MSTQKEDRPGTNGAASRTNQCAQHTALHRRRDAAARCQPLDYCGCRDPWVCRCAEPEPTTRLTEAAIDAAAHLQDHGLNPIFSTTQARALWRAGRRDLAIRCVQQVVA